MTEIEGLRERVAKAVGPDRELDAELAAAFRFYDGTAAADQKWAREWTGEWRAIQGLVHLIGEHGSGGNFIPARLTASIDASLALVSRKLPGWACGFDKGPKTCIAFVDRNDYADRFLAASFTAEGETAPLAILGALLSALEAVAALSQEEPGR